MTHHISTFIQADAFSNAFSDATRNSNGRNQGKLCDPWALGTAELNLGQARQATVGDAMQHQFWMNRQNMSKNDNSSTNDSDNS